MSDKTLKDKAIKIKGKDYVMVDSRVQYFNETYPNGSIVTEMLSETGADVVFVKATVYPDTDNPSRSFTGHSQARWGDGMVNSSAALENAETSAVGRALAFMGIGVIDSIASADEINKATAPQKPWLNEPELGNYLKQLESAQSEDELAKVAGEIKSKYMVNKLSQESINSFYSAALDRIKKAKS